MNPLPELAIDETRAEPGPEQYFVGQVGVQTIQRPPSGERGDFEVVAVFFSAGARTRPHTHTHDQFLYFIRGTGFVHLAGAEEQRPQPGSIVIIPAGIVHMHGATDAGPLAHIAIRPAGAGSHWQFDELPAGWERWLADG
jgi:quercetin dioxygenase-like cupin family protein